MKCAIYARRSKEEHQIASLDVQIGEASRYIESKGWHLLPDHIYRDDSISRAEFKKRPGLLALLIAAEAHAFDAVVVRDETRIGGDTYRSGIVIQDLLDSGTKLIYHFSDEEVKLDDAVDKFLVAARNFASELEREKIAQRTREHLATKARRGFNTGGRVYGYDNVPIVEGGHRVRVEYKVNTEQAEVVRDIFFRYSAGDGLRAIAKRLNDRGVPPPSAGRRGTGSWSPIQVRGMLLNQRYCGVLVWGRLGRAYRGGTRVCLHQPEADWIKVDLPHLRIVDEDLWTKVQLRFAEHSRSTTPWKAGVKGPLPHYLLTGLGRCSVCGGPIAVSNGKSGAKVGTRVYGCAWHRTRGDSVCGNTLRRPVDTVDAVVTAQVRQKLLREELVLETLRAIRRRLAERAKTSSKETPELEREVRRLKGEMDRLTSALATTDEKPEVIVQAINEREKRLVGLKARLAAIRTAPSVVDLEVRRMEREAKRRLHDFVAMFDRNDPAVSRKALESLLVGPLKFTPVQEDGRHRYRVEGAVNLSSLFTTVSDPTGIRTRATDVRGRRPNH